MVNTRYARLISSFSTSAPLTTFRPRFPPSTHRQFSISTTYLTPEPPLTRLPPPPPSRWISDLRSRVGKCIVFGCSNQQVSRASAVLRALAVEWKDLLAGSEGFLSGGRRGLDTHSIAWGEMDSFVSSHPPPYRLCNCPPNQTTATILTTTPPGPRQQRKLLPLRRISPSKLDHQLLSPRRPSPPTRVVRINVPQVSRL